MKWYSKPCFLGLVTLLLVTFIACSQPAPPKESVPAPVDNPTYSEGEVCAYVWSRISSDLPGEYGKCEFLPNQRSAVYQGNGEWKFEAIGSGENVTSLPPQIHEKQDPHCWVEQHENIVTTYKVKVTVNFYEKTNVAEMLNIEKFDIKTENRLSEMPISPKLLVEWIRGQYYGTRYEFEGSVTNIGKIPLHNVEFEATGYDADKNFVEKQTTELYPEFIDVGNRAHFLLRFSERIDLRYYDYRFLLPSGEVIVFEVEEED